MSKQYKIDLSDYFNHRLVSDKKTRVNDNIGLDGIYIAENDLRLSPQDESDDIEFGFKFGAADNVMCEGQHLPIALCADKLHILGFAYWGNTKDVFDAVYDDGSVDELAISFVDWSRPAVPCWLDTEKPENISTYCKMLTSGNEEHIAHFHHSITALNANKTLKELVLPDNFWLHIIALTLENTSISQNGEKA